MYSFHINKNACAYSATTLAAVLMNSIFQYYYVKLFLDYYKITSYWFNLAQVFYMIWNAINDPLFGYFQDYSQLNCLKHRQLNILYGAPLFALSFLFPWFGWTSDTSPDWVVGLHLLISLSFYDCMFTFVLLAQCSLFTEISRNNHERQNILIHSNIATLIGSTAIFMTEVNSDQMKNLSKLQFTVIIIAIVSLVLMVYSGKNVKVVVNRNVAEEKSDQSWSQAFTTSFQIFSNRNFICFVLMNFCQVFHSTYAANFFSIFREHLMTVSDLPSILRSLIAGSAFMLPSILILAFYPVLKKFGSYTLILYSFYFKVGMGVWMYFFGSKSVTLTALFMILDCGFVGATFNLFNLSVSDIVDHDQVTYKRINPVSSMVFGLNALITKPAQSIAPMLIVHILKQYGYKAKIAPGVQSSNIGGGTQEDLEGVMFNILVLFPVIIGTVQIVVWKMYRLQDTHGKENESITYEIQ